MISPIIKNILAIGICLFFYKIIDAQVIPSATTRPAASPVPVPAAYQNPGINYVRTWVSQVAITDPLIVTNASRTVQEVSQQTQYTDGLNRPIQTVVKGVSSSGKDLVSSSVYDSYGRTQYRYLPYAQQSGNNNDGKFKMDPFNSQQGFYQDNFLSPSSKGENIFYAQIEYEDAPSSTAIRNYNPGNTWAKEGGKKPQEQYLMVNTVADSVRVWDFPSNGIPVSTKSFDAGQLFKSTYKDETGAQVIQYVDKNSRLVLKKIQLSATPATGQTGWLCTYFVYDDLGNLRCVIPPLATYFVNGYWNTVNVAPGLCSQYKYDERGRNIVTKPPGADSIETVYDPLDRPVMQRDGNMKAKSQWMLTFYDGLNRPLRTAIYQSANNRDALQILTNSAPPGTFPFIAPAYLSDQSLIYYDDNYAFPGVQAAVTTDFTKPQSAASNAEPNSAISHRTGGLVTGLRVRIIGTNQWLAATIYYNDKGRKIQVITDNINSGKEVNTYLYDFTGKVLSTYLRHTNPHSAVTPQTTILKTIIYDPTGKPFEIDMTVNDSLPSKRILAYLNYDEGGVLKTKSIGINNQVPIETLNYEFTIQGWLKSVNKDYINTSNSTSNWFGEELSYDYGFNTNQYNGSIAGAKWKSRGDGIARAFGYSYDNANRLLKADFSQQNQGSINWTVDKVDFSVSNLAYDANSNITGMLQKGMKGLGIAVIDSLKYGYIPYTNQLFFVTDKKNDPQSKLGDFKEIVNDESQDYNYDASGNLAVDMNRLMSPLPYNYLNLSDSITVLGKGYIAFTYDAAGNRLRKKVTDFSGGGSITTTDYIGGFVYKNDSLQYFAHDEGRVRVLYASGQPPALVYDYFISDHLDNTRMVLTEQTNTATYAATMETANSAKENALFSNIDNTRTVKPVGYPVDNTTSPNDYVSKLNATAGTQKIGPSIVLRVMAGDTIQLGSKAFYKSTAANISSSTPADMVTALLQAFTSSTAPGDGAHGNGAGPGSPITSNFTSVNYQQLQNKDPLQNQSTKPKAYLNFVAFDDLLNLVDENSGVKQVQGNANELQTLATDRMVIKKDGFFYVYTSNESIQDVFFDNIVVAHNSGPLLEETHYYPFGLSMAGISSKALKNPYAENKNNYNGIEQTTEIGLNQYDAFYRTLDPQIGRWWQMDPSGNTYPGVSPYNSNFNNPISFTDPDGNDPGWTWLAFQLGIGQNGNGSILLDEVEVFGQNLAGKGLVEGGIQHFTTNGFNQIASIGVKAMAQPNLFERIISVGIENFKRNMIEGASTTLSLAIRGIQNFNYRLETGTTTPQVIFNDLSENPLSAVTGIAGVEGVLGDAAIEELSMVAREAEELNTVKGIKPYEVGLFKDLKARELTYDDLAVHHLVQKKPAPNAFPGYDENLAPSIALPTREHLKIPNFKGTGGAGTARQQLAHDLWNLRKYTNAPLSSQFEILNLNKRMYGKILEKIK